MLFNQLLVYISLVWLGMIAGISFLGDPFGFMVPGPKFEIGLDIGRRIYGVFNKVEWAVAMAILIVIVRQKDRRLISLGVVWFILAIQTFLLLPVLFDRVALILQGQTPPLIPRASDLRFNRNFKGGCPGGLWLPGISEFSISHRPTRTGINSLDCRNWNSELLFSTDYKDWFK